MNHERFSPDLQVTEDLEREHSIEQGLLDAADAVRGDADRKKILEEFISGEIHKRRGAYLALTFGYKGPEEPNQKVFWHDHGTFVGPDGAVYHVRTDDDGVGQMYTVPAGGQRRDVIHPYTYDSYIGPHGITGRVDFVNGVHDIAPKNTPRQMELQRLESKSPVIPRHAEGTDSTVEPALENRHSVTYEKQPTGEILGWYHDPKTNETVKLYSPEEVLAVADMLDERDAELEVAQLEVALAAAKANLYRLRKNSESANISKDEVAAVA